MSPRNQGSGVQSGRRALMGCMLALPALLFVGCSSRSQGDPRTVAERYLRALYEADSALAASLLDEGDPLRKDGAKNLQVMSEELARYAAERKGLKRVWGRNVWVKAREYETDSERATVFVNVLFHSGYTCVMRVDLVRHPKGRWCVRQEPHALRGAHKEGVNRNF